MIGCTAPDALPGPWARPARLGWPQAEAPAPLARLTPSTPGTVSVGFYQFEPTRPGPPRRRREPGRRWRRPASRRTDGIGAQASAATTPPRGGRPGRPGPSGPGRACGPGRFARRRRAPRALRVRSSDPCLGPTAGLRREGRRGPAGCGAPLAWAARAVGGRAACGECVRQSIQGVRQSGLARGALAALRKAALRAAREAALRVPLSRLALLTPRKRRLVRRSSRHQASAPQQAKYPRISVCAEPPRGYFACSAVSRAASRRDGLA
jgi:hypothetical protein